ncbi:hypothetical protein B0H14DRAFT_3600601 [Mycena olivaceomarginata]|nr:hypothetical protein B0H14DRAFT_3600601 [Mycena olivaceomarginata]
MTSTTHLHLSCQTLNVTEWREVWGSRTTPLFFLVSDSAVSEGIVVQAPVSRLRSVAVFSLAFARISRTAQIQIRLQPIHSWCSSKVGRPFLSAKIVPHTAPSFLVFIHSASNSGSTCTSVSTSVKLCRYILLSGPARLAAIPSKLCPRWRSLELHRRVGFVRLSHASRGAIEQVKLLAVEVGSKMTSNGNDPIVQY